MGNAMGPNRNTMLPTLFLAHSKNCLNKSKIGTGISFLVSIKSQPSKVQSTWFFFLKFIKKYFEQIIVNFIFKSESEAKLKSQNPKEYLFSQIEFQIIEFWLIIHWQPIIIYYRCSASPAVAIDTKWKCSIQQCMCSRKWNNTNAGNTPSLISHHIKAHWLS